MVTTRTTPDKTATSIAVIVWSTTIAKATADSKLRPAQNEHSVDFDR